MIFESVVTQFLSTISMSVVAYVRWRFLPNEGHQRTSFADDFVFQRTSFADDFVFHSELVLMMILCSS